jgi:hypothetical protein
MSNHLAIATVTAALGQIVFTSAQGAVNGVLLRFGRPTPPAQGNTERRVHVYLFQVTPHVALRNADLPTRRADGSLSKRPQAALELHYLLTFYGDDQAFEPDRMLGAVARDLHARPVLTAQNISDAISGNATALGDSDLGDAIERVRFTPHTLTLDEQSKLWSVLIQTPHALSVVYTASVVLIDALENAAPTLPVLKRGQDDRGVNTTLGSSPRLDSAWFGFVQSEGRQPPLPSLAAAQLGARVLITGDKLSGEALSLRFKHPLLPVLTVDVATADRDAQHARLTLPDDGPAQSAWAAGIYSVVADVRHGSTLASSPAWAMVLAPRISAITPNPAARNLGSVTLSVVCHPQVLPGQTATLLIADREIPAQAHAVPTATLDFVIDQAPVGNGQLVWLRIDGAESMPVRMDPANGAFAFDDTQRVSIT